MTSTPTVIICADDLGISPGANRAIREGHLRGRITHASLMANGDFAREAVREVVRACPELTVGLHLNLTYGRPLTPCPGLTARSGILQRGFGHILRSTLARDTRISAEAEREIRAQMAWMLEQQLVPAHIDSHRHIHMIPSIFRMVKRLAVEHGIPRIRIPYESLALSARIARRPPALRTGGLLKFLLMRALARQSREPTDRCFFSLLFTGEVDRGMIRRALQQGERLEVMVHPGLPAMDRSIPYYHDAQWRYRCSEGRRLEFEACLDRRPQPTAGPQDR